MYRTASLYYDSGQTQTYIRGSGLRFFGSADRFVDIDYRNKIYEYVDSGEGWAIPKFKQYNPYTMRVKGGVKVDKMTADEVEPSFGGAVLRGGRVKNWGYVESSFGKYKNKQNASDPSAAFNKNTHVMTVYHSIGHTNYTPIVTSAAGQWCDLPQVIGVYDYFFSKNKRIQSLC